MTISRNCTLAVAAVVAAAFGAAVAPASAAPITIYQNLPSSLADPPEISFHNAAGPVIADEFVPIAGGRITHLTWWGSAPTDPSFEIVLQNNNPLLGEPAITPAGNVLTGGIKQFVTPDVTPFAALPGVFQFDADVASLPAFNVAKGTDMWMTIADAADGWNWALALSGPTIGTENFNAHSSTGGICLDGGPHCGPWTDIHTDFAMQISAVPEPASFALLGGGLVALGVMARRKRRAG